jgi:transcriptional regulator with XRE-family HTH domain
MTQERLAKQAGITVTYVSRIEHGRRNLTWTALTRLCHGLGCRGRHSSQQSMRSRLLNQ